MKLVKTTFYSGVITVIRIASGFVAGKFIAIITGTPGVALIGAFNNFITMVLTFANGAVNTGIVKYTAEYNNEEDKLKDLFSTALRISIFSSVIVGTLLLTFGRSFSKWIFTTELYAQQIHVLGLTIIFYSLNSLLIAILNGKGQIKTYIIVNAAGTIAGLVLTIILSYYFKISGALYALVLAQSFVFFITVFLVVKSKWFSIDFFKQKFNKIIAVKLAHYSLMAIVSVLTVPVSQIILRNLLVTELGMDAGGVWQGMMRISDGYLMLITTSLNTYYLPKLSSLKTNEEIRKEIIKGFKIILPVVFIGCCVIYFLRFFIIKTLYTQEFLQMEVLFFWQLLGDFFKMAAWIFAYIMLAKSMTRVFVITEIFFSISYVLIGYLLVRIFLLQGIAIAFSVNYLIYLVTMIAIFRRIVFKKLDNV